MTDRKVDYDHELGNGWGKFENLILAGMKENRDLTLHALGLLQKQQDDIADIKLAQGLIAQETKTLKSEVDRLDEADGQHETDIDTIKEFVARAKGVVGVGVLVAVPILAPVVVGLFSGGVHL